MVALFPVAWVMVTPFALAALITGSLSVNRLVARHLGTLVAVGWLGVAMVLSGAFVIHGPAAELLLALGAPLAGLSFWRRGGRGEDDGPPGDEPPPSPEPEEIDWDAFLADLERWRRGRDRDRTPVPLG